MIQYFFLGNNQMTVKAPGFENFFPYHFFRNEDRFLPQRRLFVDDKFFEPFNNYLIANDDDHENYEEKSDVFDTALRIVTITFECIGTALSSLIAATISALRLILSPFIVPIAAVIKNFPKPKSYQLYSDDDDDSSPEERGVVQQHLVDPIIILFKSLLSVIVNLVTLPIAAPIALVKFGTRFGATVYEEYSKKPEDNFTTTVSSSF